MMKTQEIKGSFTFGAPILLIDAWVFQSLADYI